MPVHEWSTKEIWWATVIWLFEYVCTVGSCVLFTLPPLQPMFFLYLPTVYICKMFLLGPTYIFLSIHLPPHHTNYCLLYAQNLLYICTLFCNSHCLENKLKNHRLLNIYFSSWILSLSNLIFYKKKTFLIYQVNPMSCLKQQW